MLTRRSLISALVGATAALTLSACSSSTSDASESTSGARSSGLPDESTTTSSPTSSTTSSSAGTAITLTAASRTLTARLNDSRVAQDFARSLPRTLPWKRNAGIEYITELDKPMTETGPFYTDVQPGDIVYYNPLDSVTIIYEATSSVPTLTKMGEITSDLGAFESLPDDVVMTIQAA